MSEAAAAAEAHASQEPTARLLRACLGLPVDRTPIWLMRQAGRYLPEYRRLRQGRSMMEAITDPELACQITLLPQPLGVDGLIVFSDILPPLAGMGRPLEYVDGTGPSLPPITSTKEIDRLGCPPAAEIMAGTLQAIRLVRAELDGKLPVIGFAGAPFTLASYAIEGGGSSTYTRTRRLMYSEPAAWDRLMRKLVTVQVDYLKEQAAAGAQLLQLFDSWAGMALGREEYLRYVAPYQRSLFAAVAGAGVPMINFSTGTFAYLDAVAECGGDVIGVDWRMPLDAAWARVGARPVMGNLDPVTLLAPWDITARHARSVVRQAAGRSGHVFNLGHGILPDTPVDTVRRLVDLVHKETEASTQPSGSHRTRSADGPVGVLIMAYGGPSDVADVPGFLADIRAGRPTPSAVVEALTHNYRAIGGGSPLLGESTQQVQALQAELGEGYRCSLGMRHWSPWIEESLRAMAKTGLTRAVSIVLAPHFSSLSSRYHERVKAGLQFFDLAMEVHHVGGYHDAPELIAALAERTKQALAAWPADAPVPHVVFTAHSLPQRVVGEGGRYDLEVAATGELLAMALRLVEGSWSVAFQSAGRSAEPWLGPSLEEQLAELAADGVSGVLVVPVGFVSEHVEVLYDVDVQAAAIARQLGVRLQRATTLGTHPRYIRLLAELVRTKTQLLGWSTSLSG